MASQIIKSLTYLYKYRPRNIDCQSKLVKKITGKIKSNCDVRRNHGSPLDK